MNPRSGGSLNILLKNQKLYVQRKRAWNGHQILEYTVKAFKSLFSFLLFVLVVVDRPKATLCRVSLVFIQVSVFLMRRLVY